MKKSKGIIFIFSGIFLIAVALGIVAFNIISSYNVKINTQRIVSTLEQSIAVKTDSNQNNTAYEEIPEYELYPKKEMPVVNIEGNDYLGLLKIPRFNLSLPVMKGWSYSALQVSPCCYSGSPYTKDFVVAAHNYDSHFGKLSELTAEDEVVFIDVQGNRFYYKVDINEILNNKAVEEMTDSEYDLTLFTCTFSGYSRVTIRCTEADV